MTSRIAHQTNKYNWEFVFIGAGQDAMAVAESFKISRANAISYTASPLSVGQTFGALSKNVTNYRSDVAVNMAYTTEDREEQEKVAGK